MNWITKGLIAIFIFLGIFLLLAVWTFRSFLPFSSFLFSEGSVLITLHNNAEMRPTLGFLTGFFVFQNEGGKMSLSFYDSYDVKPPTSPKPAPEVLQKRFGTTKNWEGWVFRDSNMDFSFSNNAQTAIDFVQQDPRFTPLHFHAVVGIDLSAIADLIEAVGGVWHNDILLTGTSFFATLSSESRQFVPITKEDWLSRKNGLSHLSSALLKKSLLPWHWKNIAQSIQKSFEDQHILVWFADRERQKDMQQKNWTGEMQHAKNTLLYGHFFTNLGGKKSDRYVQKKIQSVFSVDDFGNITETFTLFLTHAGTRNVFSDRYFAEVALLRPQGVQVVSSVGNFDEKPLLQPDHSIRFFIWLDESSTASYSITLKYPEHSSASFVAPLGFSPIRQPGTVDSLVSAEVFFQGSGQTSFSLAGCKTQWAHENVSFCNASLSVPFFAQWHADITPPFLEEMVWQDERKTLRIQLSEEITPVMASDISFLQNEKRILPSRISLEKLAVILHFENAPPLATSEKYVINIPATDLFGNSAVVVGAVR